MALYIDSAYLDDIANVVQTVPVAGVTTNPSILLAARERGQAIAYETLVGEILEQLNTGIGSVFMQPGATDDDEMYQQVLASWQAVLSAGYGASRLVHKLPMPAAGMRVAQRLKKNQMNHRIAFTAVTTAITCPPDR